MTISTTTNRKVYSANGATTIFAYDYLILDQTHLNVYLLIGGVLVLQTLTTDYTVSGVDNPSGGNVTFVSAPAAGTANVVIQRVVPLTQLVDYVANDAFPADTHEEALDLLTMITQQLSDALARAVVLALNDTSGASLELPTPTANNYWRWNSSADAIEFVTLASMGALVLPVAIAEGGTGATTANGALTALGAEPADATILKDADIGTAVQAYDANTAKLNVDQAWSGSQRGTITTDNDLSFDQNAANNFFCTPTAGGALTFTNHTSGQSGFILFVNGSNYAITAAATTKVDSSFLSTISTTGTYLISYLDNGTNAYCVASKALT
jgi:hypothetical protein